MAKNQNKTDQELTLHLPLKKEWYSMIEKGEKREEYREFLSNVNPFMLKTQYIF